MTDADLTLRDEVAEVLADHHWAAEVSPPEGIDPYLWCVCGWRSDDATSADWRSGEHARLAHAHVADALLPLLARVREEGEARVRERVEAVLEAEERRCSGADPAYQRLHPSQIRAALAEPEHPVPGPETAPERPTGASGVSVDPDEDGRAL